MKKLLILSAIALALSISTVANAMTVVQKDMGYITVNSSAYKEVTPDTASIQFAVETVSKDSKVAVNQNKEISAGLILSLKQILAAEASDSIQTKNFVLRPNYVTDKNGNREFQNYTAINTIYVKTKNLDNISKLIDTASVNNATRISDLQFFVENEKQYSGELAKEAINKAKTIAQLTANTLNQKVNGVKSVRVSIYPVNQYNNRVYATANKVDSTPVEYGKIKLQANVDAEFYVK